jgi:hypothetical protein
LPAAGASAAASARRRRRRRSYPPSFRTLPSEFHLVLLGLRVGLPARPCRPHRGYCTRKERTSRRYGSAGSADTRQGGYSKWFVGDACCPIHPSYSISSPDPCARLRCGRVVVVVKDLDAPRSSASIISWAALSSNVGSVGVHYRIEGTRAAHGQVPDLRLLGHGTTNEGLTPSPFSSPSTICGYRWSSVAATKNVVRGGHGRPAIVVACFVGGGTSCLLLTRFVFRPPVLAFASRGCFCFCSFG